MKTEITTLNKPRKAKAAPTLNKLNASQRAELEQWLMTDGLTYKAIAQKAWDAWGLKLGMSFLCNHRQQICAPKIFERAVAQAADEKIILEISLVQGKIQIALRLAPLQETGKGKA